MQQLCDHVMQCSGHAMQTPCDNLLQCSGHLKDLRPALQAHTPSTTRITHELKLLRGGLRCVLADGLGVRSGQILADGLVVRSGQILGLLDRRRRDGLVVPRGQILGLLDRCRRDGLVVPRGQILALVGSRLPPNTFGRSRLLLSRFRWCSRLLLSR